VVGFAREPAGAAKFAGKGELAKYCRSRKRHLGLQMVSRLLPKGYSLMKVEMAHSGVLRVVVGHFLAGSWAAEPGMVPAPHL